MRKERTLLSLADTRDTEVPTGTFPVKKVSLCSLYTKYNHRIDFPLYKSRITTVGKIF